MPKLIILGTAHAIPDEDHENTYLALLGERRRILIDCAGNTQVRIKQAGIDLLEITDLFLTVVEDLFAGFEPGSVVYRYPTDFSNYFDAGHEWWGAGLWTVYTPSRPWLMGIAASSTD